MDHPIQIVKWTLKWYSGIVDVPDLASIGSLQTGKQGFTAAATQPHLEVISTQDLGPKTFFRYRLKPSCNHFIGGEQKHERETCNSAGIPNGDLLF